MGLHEPAHVLIKKYIFAIVGIMINSFAVAMITLADLGTSPISSVPYVLSLGFTPTIGQFTIVYSLLLLALQVLLLRKNFPIVQLLQIPVSVLFGYFIDFSMNHLLFWLDPQNYAVKFAALLIGCCILGFGVMMEFVANVIVLPGEGLVTAICQKVHKEKGIIKIIVDVSMCVCAIILSFIILGGLHGVREGSIVSALLVGYISRFFARFARKPAERFFYAAKHRVQAGV